MKRIKVGILGVGHLGRFHTQNYLTLEQAEVVGVYDTNYERSKQIGTEFQVPVYRDLDSLLEKIEAASIVVTTSSHYEIAKACLERSVNCLVEKPITSTLAEADELIELANRNNLILQVGHIERFNPALVALNDFELSPMFIESHRLASFNPRGTDVAVVLDLMIHDIDIILHLVKSPVVQIDASGVAVITKAVDIANARIKFANDCVANVTASRISQKAMRKMRLFQKNAYIGIDFLQKFSELFQLVDAEDFKPQANQIPIEFGQISNDQIPKKIIYERRQVEEANALKMELASFLHSVETGEKPAVSGEDGREALRVAIEITQLIEEQVEKFL